MSANDTDRATPAWEQRILGAALDFQYPETPETRHNVLARLAEPAPSGRAWLPRAGLAAGAFVIAAALGLAAFDDAREAVAGFLGLAVEGTRIEITSSTPTTTAETPAATTVPLGGRVVGLEEAAGTLGFTPRLPASSGMPDEVRLLEFGDEGAAVLLRYPSFELWQIATGNPFVLKGIITNEDVVEQTMVGDAFAYWVARSPRVVTFLDLDGHAIAGSDRTVKAPALIWTAEGIYYRIEGDLSLDEALAIAASLE